MPAHWRPATGQRCRLAATVAGEVESFPPLARSRRARSEASISHGVLVTPPKAAG
jgi:hypothetical protein